MPPLFSPPTPAQGAAMVERIRSKGFRKWYEGRLVESHLHLITTFLCLIAVLGAIEQGGPYNAWDKTAWLLLVTVGLGSLGAWCWHRYFAILQVAEFLVSRADCPQCAAYGRFNLAGTSPRPEDDGPEAVRQTPVLNVVCRKCGTGWSL